jgi:hypothetical protein
MNTQDIAGTLQRLMLAILVAPFLIPATVAGEGGQAAKQYGILGRQAPELDLDTWIDGEGFLFQYPR